jgi:hypothetical protein
MLVGVLDFLLIALALSLNHLFLGWIPSSDGSVDSVFLKVLVWLLDAFLVLIGIMMIKLRSKNLRRTLVQGVGLISLGLIIAELLLHLVPASQYFRIYPLQTGPPVTTDIYLGWRNVGNTFFIYNQEGFSTGTTNNQGWNDRQREPSRDTRKILVLGDSIVEAFQVSQSNSFPNLLEKWLNERFVEQEFEVIPMGKAGYGTGQELLVYEHFGRQFNPEVIVLIVTISNDFADNLPREEYTIRIQGGGRQTFFSIIKRYLRLPHIFFALDERAVETQEEVVAARVTELDKEEMIKSLIDPDRAEPDPIHTASGITPEFRDAIRLTAHFMSKLHEEVGKDSARLLVVLLPTTQQISRPMVDALTERFPSFDPSLPNSLLLDDISTLNQNVAIMDIRLDMLNHFAGRDEFPYGFPPVIAPGVGHGHLNEVGHPYLAAVLFEALVPWLEP